jgi:hypothetical protein
MRARLAGAKIAGQLFQVGSGRVPNSPPLHPRASPTDQIESLPRFDAQRSIGALAPSGEHVYRVLAATVEQRRDRAAIEVIQAATGQGSPGSRT